MINQLSIPDFLDIVNTSLCVSSALLGLSAGTIFWWFMLKD